MTFQQIVGSDIAELLMQGSRSDGSWELEPPTLIDFSEGGATEAPPQTGDDLLTGTCSFSPETSEKALYSYTELLLAGRKKVSDTMPNHLIVPPYGRTWTASILIQDVNTCFNSYDRIITFIQLLLTVIQLKYLYSGYKNEEWVVTGKAITDTAHANINDHCVPYMHVTPSWDLSVCPLTLTPVVPRRPWSQLWAAACGGMHFFWPAKWTAGPTPACWTGERSMVFWHMTALHAGGDWWRNAPF